MDRKLAKELQRLKTRGNLKVGKKLDQPMDSRELEYIMERLELSPSQLAIALGVTRPCIDHWMSERRSIPISAVKLVRYWMRNPEVVEDFLYG